MAIRTNPSWISRGALPRISVLGLTLLGFGLLLDSVAISVSAAPAPLLEKKAVSDDFIHDTVRRKLTSDQNVKGGALDIDVKDGVVTLKGTVETERQKDKAEKIVKKTGGVKSVVNQIKIAKP